MLRRIVVAGFLVGALGVLGCSSSASSSPTPAPSSQDNAIKAFQDGKDTSIPLLADVAATTPPSALSQVATWSVAYQVIAADDPDPANRYEGVMLTGKDANGTAVILVPKAIMDQGVATMFFNAAPDDQGNLVPYDLDPNSDDAAVADDAKNAIAWIQSESQRLGDMTSQNFLSSDPSSADTSNQSLRLHPLGGTTMTQGIECVAHLAVFALAFSNPIAFLVADAAVDVAGGFVNGDPGNGIVGGATNVTLAGIIKAVAKMAGISTGTAAARVLVPVAALAVGYQVYEGKSLTSVLESFVPRSCIQAATAIIK